VDVTVALMTQPFQGDFAECLRSSLVIPFCREWPLDFENSRCRRADSNDGKGCAPWKGGAFQRV